MRGVTVFGAGYARPALSAGAVAVDPVTLPAVLACAHPGTSGTPSILRTLCEQK